MPLNHFESPCKGFAHGGLEIGLQGSFAEDWQNLGGQRLEHALVHGIEESAHVAEPCVEGAGRSFGTLDDRLEGEGRASAFVEKLLPGVEHTVHRLDASLLNGCSTSHSRTLLCRWRTRSLAREARSQVMG